MATTTTSRIPGVCILKRAQLSIALHRFCDEFGEVPHFAVFVNQQDFRARLREAFCQ